MIFEKMLFQSMLANRTVLFKSERTIHTLYILGYFVYRFEMLSECVLVTKFQFAEFAVVDDFFFGKMNWLFVLSKRLFCVEFSLSKFSGIFIHYLCMKFANMKSFLFSIVKVYISFFSMQFMGILIVIIQSKFRFKYFKTLTTFPIYFFMALLSVVIQCPSCIEVFIIALFSRVLIM